MKRSAGCGEIITTGQETKKGLEWLGNCHHAAMSREDGWAEIGTFAETDRGVLRYVMKWNVSAMELRNYVNEVINEPFFGLFMGYDNFIWAEIVAARRE